MFKMGKKENKGLAIKKLAKYYDLGNSEKSKLRISTIKLANIKKGEKILDVGCGTGSYAVLARQITGETGYVAGIDISTKMLDIARNKNNKYGLNIDYIEASIDKLPFSENHFDCVMSTLMFHHLPVNIKRKGLKEIYRVLKPDGRLFFLDFAKPHGILGYLMFPFMLFMKSTRVQVFGKLPEYFKESEFTKIKLIKEGQAVEYYLIEK
jgi:ubiquinone/menaquinone biosynthesis C-methylase UbiE